VVCGIAAELAEAGAVVEVAGEAVVAGVLAGSADFKAAFGFGDGGGVGALLKDDILQAYQERGGIAWLRELSDNLFARLLTKVMPKEISADVRATARIQQQQAEAEYADEELRRLCENVVARADHTGLIDTVEAALTTGDLQAVANKLSLLDEVITKHQKQADECLTKVHRAEQNKIKYAKAQGKKS